MQHTIRKGNHRSNRSWFPRFHFGKCRQSYKVTFFTGGKYDLHGSDQLDINKLFGLSYGMHHVNSVRFGWRWDLRKEMIEILAYVYVDGKRITEVDASIHVGFVFPGIPYYYTIDVTESHYTFTLESILFQNSEFVSIKHDNLTWWGYKLFPYFGGNQVAPEKVIIDMIAL